MGKEYTQKNTHAAMQNYDIALLHFKRVTEDHPKKT